MRVDHASLPFARDEQPHQLLEHRLAAQLIDQADADALRFAPYEPAWPAGLPQQGLFEHLRHHDCLLHHPFESFDAVVQFLREAVYDPDVLAIKQTIYRTGSESVLMELLLEAVRRGKEVLAVVELKARFDEEANINWAERLEALGAQVVYGIVGLKTHAKMMLVTRREGSRLRRYAHLSTGNYNPRTSRLYTDVGFLTSQPDMTADVDRVFQQLSSLTQMKSTRLLQLAPFSLQDQMLRLIARCADAARAGRQARVVVKCNALTDEPLVNALIDAGQAGVDIDLIVRGACILPPGLEGLTDRIRVRSVVGRMLEHTRVLYFRWGTDDYEEALYLSSADWMNRNMTRRIEAAAVADPSPDPSKALATVESSADLARWLAVAASAAKPAGTLLVIHRSDRLDEIARRAGYGSTHAFARAFRELEPLSELMLVALPEEAFFRGYLQSRLSEASPRRPATARARRACTSSRRAESTALRNSGKASRVARI